MYSSLEIKQMKGVAKNILHVHVCVMVSMAYSEFVCFETEGKNKWSCLLIKDKLGQTHPQCKCGLAS